MGFFESLFYTIWRGIAIGILISAPMGPVGILVIQRTLDKGRKTGLYTGVGAAISDLFYCILTGFGLSFIEEFLERNQNVIQLVGSIVLIAFAFYLFKKNPASSLKTPEQEGIQISPHKNILGGFFFTFSNPLILFLIIGLFARFNFSIPEISFYYYIAGYIAIFFGALIWWEFVTFTVNKLRAHFNLRSMWLINKIIGGIILLFAIVGTVTSVTNLASAETLNWNKGRSYLPFKYATADGIIIDNPTDTLKYDYYPLSVRTSEFSLNFRARNINGNPSKKYSYLNHQGKRVAIRNPHWGFFITSLSDTLIYTVRSGEKVNAMETVPCLEITQYTMRDYGFGMRERRQQEGLRKEITESFNPYDGDNFWTVNIADGILTLYGGDTHQVKLFDIGIGSYITGFGFFAGWGDKVKISDIRAEWPDSQSDYFAKSISPDILKEPLMASEDPMEGYWTIFDRELEESLLKLGGFYSLACIKTGEDYYFYYLDGATVNSNNWKPGDLKAVLSPTPFPNIYDVEWIDSMKESMKKDIKAQTGEGNTLLFQFPYQSSKLRLRKIPD